MRVGRGLVALRGKGPRTRLSAQRFALCICLALVWGSFLSPLDRASWKYGGAGQILRQGELLDGSTLGF